MHHFPPLRIGLLFSAFYLTHRAQHILTTPLDQVYNQLLSQHWITGDADPTQASRCALFAASLMTRFGYDGGCLVRSLVVARLLCRKPGLMLHIGFHPAAGLPEPAPVGHAWIMLDGVNLSDHSPLETSQGIITTRTLSMYRAAQ